MSILTAFNNHFIEFLEDVSNIFPNDKDIKKSKVSLELLKKANPRLIIKVWKEQIASKYREKIEAGDISFFLNKDYSSDIDGANESTKIMSSIERLRVPISNMGEDNQEKTMKYIQNLTKLSDLY
jgi:hypothetical protein